MYGEHTTAMFAVGFLALVQTYGFQPALMSSGLIMRKQFFNPHGFIDKVPWNCQMLLMADDYIPPVEDTEYWERPFRFALEGGACTFVVRNISIRLPVSRDPRIPVANHVRFAPKRYTFAPNFYTIFE